MSEHLTPSNPGARNDDPPHESDRPSGHGPWIPFDEVAGLRAEAEARGIDLTRAMPTHPHGRHVAARVELVGDRTTLVKTPTAWVVPESRDVSTGEFVCIVTPEVVLTAEVGGAGVHERIRRALDAVAGAGVADVTSAVVAALAGSASEVDLDLGDAVAEVEGIVFRPDPPDPVDAIYGLKREISEARRALVPFSTQLTTLEPPESAHPVLGRHVLVRLGATIERIDQHLDAYDSLLSDLLSVHLSRVSVQQNDDMRKISAWAAIFAIPTIVTGVYGMNFTHMPELTWTFGYPASILLCVVACGALFGVFRRSGWL